MERLKAQLVVRGDVQKEGVDFTKSLIIFVKITIISCVLEISIKKG